MTKKLELDLSELSAEEKKSVLDFVAQKQKVNRERKKQKEMQAKVDKVFTAYCKRQNFNGMSEEDKMYRGLGESVYKYFHEYVKDADKMSSNEIFRYLDKIIDQSGYRKI